MPNITLRNITKDDVNYIRLNWINNDRMLIFPNNEYELQDMLNSLRSKKYYGKYFEMFLIVDKVPVGIVSLFEITKNEVSVGINIDSIHRHKGYATAAYKKILQISKTKGYKYISAGVRLDNFAGVKLHEIFGFRLESTKINTRGHEQARYVLQI